MLTLSVPLTIPAQFLKAIGGNFHLQAGTTGVAVHLSGQLSHAGAGSFAFFGFPLDTARQLVGEITLNLPVVRPRVRAVCLVEVTGSAQVRTVAAGGVVFAGEAFTVGVVIDELPAVPNVLPIPTLRFPEIGRTGRHPLPWPDPAALSFPFPTVGQPLRLPVPSLSFLKFLADSPIQISWQSAFVTTDPSGVVALEITNSQISFSVRRHRGETAFAIRSQRRAQRRPELLRLAAARERAPSVRAVAIRRRRPRVAVEWPSLAGLVRVLLPDVDDFQFENPVTPTDHPPQVTLRVLSDAQGVSELRLDWLRKANGNVVDDAIELPGFRLESKSAPMWSLLSRRDAGRDRLAFVVTLPQNAAVAAHTAFN